MSKAPEENYLDFQVFTAVKADSQVIYTKEIRQHDLEQISIKNGKKYDFIRIDDIKGNLPPNILRQITTLEGWLTIRNDLRFVNESLEFILTSNVDNNWQKILQNIYFSIIVTYGKCFNSANGRATLDKNTFFKKNKEVGEIHEKMIEVRNNYVAHGAAGYNTVTEVFYAIEKGNPDNPDKQIESISAAISIPNFNLLRQYQNVVHTVHDKLDNSIWSLQKNIQNRLESIFTSEELKNLVNYTNNK